MRKSLRLSAGGVDKASGTQTGATATKTTLSSVAMPSTSNGTCNGENDNHRDMNTRPSLSNDFVAAAAAPVDNLAINSASDGIAPAIVVNGVSQGVSTANNSDSNLTCQKCNTFIAVSYHGLKIHQSRCRPVVDPKPAKSVRCSKPILEELVKGIVSPKSFSSEIIATLQPPYKCYHSQCNQAQSGGELQNLSLNSTSVVSNGNVEKTFDSLLALQQHYMQDHCSIFSPNVVEGFTSPLARQIILSELGSLHCPRCPAMYYIVQSFLYHEKNCEGVPSEEEEEERRTNNGDVNVDNLKLEFSQDDANLMTNIDQPLPPSIATLVSASKGTNIDMAEAVKLLLSIPQDSLPFECLLCTAMGISDTPAMILATSDIQKHFMAEHCCLYSCFDHSTSSPGFVTVNVGNDLSYCVFRSLGALQLIRERLGHLRCVVCRKDFRSPLDFFVQHEISCFHFGGKQPTIRRKAKRKQKKISKEADEIPPSDEISESNGHKGNRRNAAKAAQKRIAKQAESIDDDDDDDDDDSRSTKKRKTQSCSAVSSCSESAPDSSSSDDTSGDGDKTDDDPSSPSRQQFRSEGWAAPSLVHGPPFLPTDIKCIASSYVSSLASISTRCVAELSCSNHTSWYSLDDFADRLKFLPLSVSAAADNDLHSISYRCAGFSSIKKLLPFSAGKRFI